MNSEKEILAVRDRLKVLIGMIPHPLTEIAAQIGIAYATLVNYLNGKKIPRRLSFIKIRNYVDAIENQFEFEETH